VAARSSNNHVPHYTAPHPKRQWSSILNLLFMLVRHTITITKLRPSSVNFFVYYIIPSFTCFGPWAIIRREI
jgi:hypothetical protein